MCVAPVRCITHEFIPRPIKPHCVTASEVVWPNLFRDSIVHNFIPRRMSTCSASLLASDLWPKPNSFDSLIRKCPCTLQNDVSSLRFGKRTRIASDSRCTNWTQVYPELNMGYTVQVHQESRWSLSVERLPERTNKRQNHWHNNSESRLANKRKMCDLNVNLDDNLECSWPLLSETSDEDDNDETSNSASDSEAYSGPS